MTDQFRAAHRLAELVREALAKYDPQHAPTGYSEMREALAEWDRTADTQSGHHE